MHTNVPLALGILRYALAFLFLAIGTDQAFHTELITDWEALLGPLAQTLFPFAPETVVRIEGVLALISAGVLLATPFVRIGAGLAIALTLASIVDLSSARYYVLVIKDVFLIAASISLILLSPRR